ncbi:glycosyltransferase family 69 protein [Rhizopogon vinicolor AM-OR11-026]|uniref:Glycosyltransferase family 69 protein n=1 Tax=Rhizopogon vinicolor AM-OR11-026 TaxID=1314800 RepID=A0A1B7MUN7_9AGAM|nr:glycosyltransferase family 69 protein [Rhizopogon vinicolor AM-OR11-026]
MFQRNGRGRDRRESFNATDEENSLVDGAEGYSERSFSRPTSPTARLARHVKARQIQLLAYVTLFCVSTWVGVHYEQSGDVRYRDAIQAAVARPRRQGYGKQEKIFIVAMFHNNEQVIPYWHNSLIKVIHYLGPDNVFVSIVESHSTDGSPHLLYALDADLARMDVPRRILTGDEAVTKPDDMNGNNRIEFLAATRNRAMEPLMEGGYDRVVFSNDIYIEPESMVELLETNNGNYDMACGLDFGHFGAYDMWVLRDRQAKLASGIWPYFFDEADYHAMQADSPVPVFTCWNGIVAFAADPLLPIALRSNRTLSNNSLPYNLPSTHPAAHNSSMRGPNPALTPPIRFRASAPGECFSSESFLLPYDMRRQFNLQQIYVNPRVINGYDWRFYVYFKWLMRHPVLRWWIENVYNGAWMARAVMVVGDPERVSRWDGGDCHPWWF